MADLTPDFTEPAFTSCKPSLAELAENKLPIIVPWNKEQIIYPGQLFRSSLYRSSNPWSDRSCFLSKERNSQGSQEEGTPERNNFKFVYTNTAGGTSSSFKSTKTTQSIAKNNHESYGFTATAEIGFIKAQGSIEYDKRLAKNNDNCKTSIRASYRCGSILIRQTPSLTQEAARILKYEDGLHQFERIYGDYYVSGFNLGADITMMTSTNTTSMSSNERKSLEVSAKAFLLNVGHKEYFDSASASGSAQLIISGYDTLSGGEIDKAISWGESATTQFNDVQQQTSDMLAKGYALAARTETEAVKLGLKEKRSIAMERDSEASRDLFEFEIDKEICTQLLKSSLVVEMVLMPVRTLRNVQYWMLEDDII